MIVSENLIGYLDIKSTPGVYFYVQRNTAIGDTNQPQVVRFNIERLNIGRAMNMATGVFTAPKPGIYRFLFHGTKSYLQAASLHIDLRVNGVNIGNAYAHHYENVGMLSIGVHSVVKLKTGDEVILYKAGEGWLYDDNTPDTHFSGCLVEEELVI